MNNSVNLLLVKDLVHAFFIQHVFFVKNNFLAGDLFHPLQSLLAGIVKVVHDNDLISGV